MLAEIRRRRLEKENPPPSSHAPNPERREQKAQETAKEAEKKGYEVRSRSIKTTGISKEKKAYLKDHNNNEYGHIFCQICHSRMPFVIKGEDYFEAIEFVRAVTKEIPSNALALCPNCAAEFTYACATPEQKRIEQLVSLDSKTADETEWILPIQLPVHTHIRFFSQKHLIDLQGALQHHLESLDEDTTSDLDGEGDNDFAKVLPQDAAPAAETSLNPLQAPASSALPITSAPIGLLRSNPDIIIRRKTSPALITSKSNTPTTSQPTTNISDKRVERAIVGMTKLYNCNDKMVIISKIIEIINRFMGHVEFMSLLQSEGIHVTTLKMAIDHLIPGFSSQSLGFSKYAELINDICTTTGCATLYFKRPAEIRLNRNNCRIPGYILFGQNN